jgi:poly(A) polymerase
MPRRFTGPMREMLALQPRFAVTKGRRALKFLEHRRFRAAYDLMMLRAEVGDVERRTAEFWTEVQTQNAEQRLKSFDLAGKPDGREGRRRPRRRRPPQANKP